MISYQNQTKTQNFKIIALNISILSNKRCLPQTNLNLLIDLISIITEIEENF